MKTTNTTVDVYETMKEIEEALTNSSKEDEEYISKLPSSNGVETVENPIYEPITVTETVATNINNGLMFPTNDIDTKLEELLDVKMEDILTVPDNINDIELRTEDIYKNAVSGYGINEKDVQLLLPYLDRKRAGEDIEYKDLPLEIKRIIHAQCASVGNFSNEAKNLFTDALLTGIITDSGIDKLKIDLEESLNNTFDLKDLNKSVMETSKYNFEVKLEEQAKQLEEKGELEKAKSVRKVIEGWKESYLLTDFKANLRKIKIKKIDFEKINRVCEEFNYKYENQRYFEIHDVKKLMPALGSLFPQYSRASRDALVIAFCKYCKNKSSSNVADHTFMSYFILNTIQAMMLKDEEMTHQIIESLTECLEILSEKY